MDYPTGLPADQLSSQLSVAGADGWKLINIVDSKQNERRATFVAGENPTEYMVVDTVVGKPPAELEALLDQAGADGWLLTSVEMLQQAARRVIFTRTQFPSATQTFDYRFSTNNTPPTQSGEVEFDSDDPTLAGYVWIDYLTDGGTDVRNILSGLKKDDQIYIQDKNDATVYFLFKLTSDAHDRGDCYEFAVAWQESGTGGRLGNNEPIVLSIGGGSTVGGGGSFPDAPLDGNTYGRQSAAWNRALAYDNDSLDGGTF